LRGTEEIIGHQYETISVWLKRTVSQAQALTQVLASDLHLSQVEIDEFWSWVQKNGAACQVGEGKR
jgi:phosphodiesterase/alkaline phosphatase D-like protein